MENQRKLIRLRDIIGHLPSFSDEEIRKKFNLEDPYLAKFLKKGAHSYLGLDKEGLIKTREKWRDFFYKKLGPVKARTHTEGLVSYLPVISAVHSLAGGEDLSGLTIVEIGPGPYMGRGVPALEYLRSKGADVIGVDSNPGKSGYPPIFPNLVIKGNAEDLENILKRKKADIVFTNNMDPLFSNSNLEIIDRILAPNGVYMDHSVFGDFRPDWKIFEKKGYDIFAFEHPHPKLKKAFPHGYKNPLTDETKLTGDFPRFGNSLIIGQKPE